MKAMCHVCMGTFDVLSVKIGNKLSDMLLFPTHQPYRDAMVKMSCVHDSKTGKVLETMCDGSLRPVRVDHNIPQPS